MSRLTIVNIFHRNIFWNIVFSSFLCDCAVNQNEVNKVYDVSVSYQAATKALIAQGAYDNKDDFTVVVQPFMEHMTVPTTVI